MGRSIHPTAVVSAEAELGEGVIIGPYSVVDGRVKIGDDVRIEAFVHICDYVEIGSGSRVFEYAAIGGLPQDHGFKNEITYVKLGENVTVRENVTINRGTGEGSATIVGDNSLIMDGCHLAHNVKLGKNCTITNKVGIAGHCDVGDNVVVGGLTGVHQFVKIGDYAMVGGMAKIIKDVPPYCLVDGLPGRVYGLNTVGLRRNGFSQEERNHIKDIYRVLYGRHHSRVESLAEIERLWPDDEIALGIVAFVRGLRRGLTPWASGERKRGDREEGER